MTTDRAIRAFVALEIPDRIKSALAADRDRLRNDLPAARWTRPEGWHLTLKFLGDSRTAILDSMAGDLAAGLADCSAVTIRFSGSGFFPSTSRPRVAWIGGAAEGAEKVVQAVRRAADAAGFERDRRPWALHLTLARLRRPWPRSDAERFLEWGDLVNPPEFACGEVVLFQSDLRPEGAVYTALQRFPLR